MTRSWDDIKPSNRSLIIHPLLSFGAQLAKITDANLAPENKEGCKKPVLSLAVGDPAIDGNLPPPKNFMDSLAKHVESVKANGYTLSEGTSQARQAVADYWFRNFVSHPADNPNEANTLISYTDVILTSGCSDAVNIAFGAIANPDEIILFPQPFFAQYEMSAKYYGIIPEFYDLVAEKNWEIDLPGLEALVKHIREAAPNRPIRGILLNNPSNPCGSNWSASHVRDIVHLCERLHLPILSDEIYAGMVFNIHEEDNSNHPIVAKFTSAADIKDSNCPRFVLAGASKRFSVPGERFGWIIRLDESNYARYLGTAGSSNKTAESVTTKAVMVGMKRLCARYLIPMTALQAAMVDCLNNESPEEAAYFERTRCLLRDNAKYLFEELGKVDALTPIEPQGSMFMSVLINPEKLEPSVRGDVAFCNGLAREENVHMFPGEPFRMPSAVRLVLSRPMELNKDVVERLRGFCERHRCHE